MGAQKSWEHFKIQKYHTKVLQISNLKLIQQVHGKKQKYWYYYTKLNMSCWARTNRGGIKLSQDKMRKDIMNGRRMRLSLILGYTTDFQWHISKTIIQDALSLYFVHIFAPKIKYFQLLGHAVFAGMQIFYDKGKSVAYMVSVWFSVQLPVIKNKCLLGLVVQAYRKFQNNTIHTYFGSFCTIVVFPDCCDSTYCNDT